MAIRMRAEDLLHPVASAKGQIAFGVEFPVSAAQCSSRRFVTVVTSHHRKPIEKESCQRQSMPLCRFASKVRQATPRKGENHLRPEGFDSVFQGSVRD